MVCSIGELTGESCGNRVKRKLGEEISASLQLFEIDELDGDLSNYFSTTQQVCQNVTLKENWIIKQNVGVDLSQRGTICWKHRDHYDSKFKIRSSKCMYPGNIESKRKLTVKTMSLPAVLHNRKVVQQCHHQSDSAFWSILVYQLHGLASSIQLGKALKAP